MSRALQPHPAPPRRPSRLGLPLLAVALVATVLAPTAVAAEVTSSAVAEPEGATSAVAHAAADEVEPRRLRRQVRRATNRRRDRRDLVELRRQRCLDRQATRWARHLAANDDFEHQDLHRILDRCELRLVGENLAMGYTTGNSAVRAWMDSPGHRANLLRRGFRRTGVGVAEGPRGWIIVQLLGRGWG